MRKRKAYPGSLYDFYGVEQWLNLLAKENLYLEDFSSFGHLGIFQRGEPKRVRYHVEPDLSQYRDREDEYNLSEEWELVCKVSGVCLVYATEDPWAAKPAKWKIEDKYLRKKQRSLWLNFVLWVVTIGLAGWRIAIDFFPDRNIYYMDWLQLLPLVFFSSVLLALAEVGKGLPQLYDIWVWRRSFLMGEEVEQHSVMAIFRWGEQWILPSILAVAMLSVVFLSGGSTRHLRPLDQYDDPLPLVTLDVTEDVIHYAPKPYGPDIDVSVKHRLLIPDDIHISSSGLYENPGDVHAWMDYGFPGNADAEMHFEYYRLWTETMAVKLAEDEAKHAAEYSTCHKVTHNQFDDLWICEVPMWMGHAESQRIIAREGDVVIRLGYYGNEVLGEHLEEIYRIVMDYRNN